MNWKNTFEVAASPDRVFATLTDIPSIAPCMPGAQLTGTTEDGGYEGIVKVKLGPITAQYRGRAHLTESDAGSYRAVLLAEGSETRGQGTASATITALCHQRGEGTTVEIETDLHITGKVAQFGRGVLQDVSAKLIGQFAECLSTTLFTPGRGSDTGDAVGAPVEGVCSGGDPQTERLSEREAQVEGLVDAIPTGPRHQTTPVPRAVPDAVDLADVAGAAVIKRVIPVVVALAGAVILWRVVRSRMA